MSATNLLTEQTSCPGHPCPQGAHPHSWYDIRYSAGYGSIDDPQARLDYWSKVDRPAGLHSGCPYCLRMSDFVDQQVFMALEAQKRRAAWLAKKKVKNGRHVGAWELTLTYSPAWYQDDAEAQAALRLAVDRLTRYYQNELVEFRAVGEFTKDHRAHLHCFYRLEKGGKMTDKNLQRAYPHWNARVKVGRGNQGGHHAPVQVESDYSGYMEKDLETSWFHMAYPSNAVS